MAKICTNCGDKFLEGSVDGDDLIEANEMLFGKKSDFFFCSLTCAKRYYEKQKAGITKPGGIYTTDNRIIE